jgi:hypothetical protein
MAGKLAQQRLSQPNFNAIDPSNRVTMNENGVRAVKSTNNRGVQTKSFLNQIRDTVSDAGGDISKGLKDVGHAITNPSVLVPSDMSNAVNGMKKGLEAARGPTPKSQDNTEQIRNQQQQSYQDFQRNLPGYQRQMQEGLSNVANRSMYQNMRDVDQRNTSRGLGYGGLNEGMQAGEQARSQQNLANQITQGNVGLLDLGNQIQSGAITTGLGQQSNLQQRLNQLYSQRMADYNSQNQQTASMLGLLANAGMMAAMG